MSCDNGNGSNSEMQSKAPLKCRNGCGFYGTQSFEGFCSKCYKDKVKKQMQTIQASPSSSPSNHYNPPTSFTDQDISDQIFNLSVNSIDSSNASTSEFQNSQNIDKDIDIAETVSRELQLVEATTSQPVEDITSQPKKNRCLTCKKRVGLTGFACRCNGLFCALHRYSDKHDCTYNYKDAGQEEIRRNNPTIISSKITKL